MRIIYLFIVSAAFFSVPFMVGGLSAAERAEKDAKQDLFLVHDDLFNLYQPYIDNISGYKPVYFLVGANPENTKLQISMKYRFVNPDMAFAQKYPWIRGFHIAYTQSSFWNLRGESKPFKDTSYKPEFFFLSRNLFSGKKASHWFVQAGAEHESNGQAGETSRSTNYIYIRPIYVYFQENSAVGFQIAPKIWTYHANSDSTNPDIHKYRGYFDLECKIGQANHLVLETHWRWAEKGHSVSMDLSYPLDRLIRWNPQLYLHVQYVNALGESLLRYTEKSEAFRIGISVIR